MARDRRADQARRSGARGDGAPRRRPGPQAARHRRAAGLDAGASPTRRSPRWPTRHFDIPEPIRRLECRIAPTNTGGIYYTGPSRRPVTRPGRMWWSVPTGVTEFATWRELTTVYHEGVPGHHLQIAQTVYRTRAAQPLAAAGVLGRRARRGLGAVRRAADGRPRLPGRPGRLPRACSTRQSLRAARVVLDIGVHCGFQAPAEVGGGAWDYDKAWQFLTAHANMAERFLRFELDRYLGWPGQAPSYKIGERLWLQLRDETRARRGRRLRPQGLPPAGAGHRQRRPGRAAPGGARRAVIGGPGARSAAVRRPGAGPQPSVSQQPGQRRWSPSPPRTVAVSRTGPSGRMYNS